MKKLIFTISVLVLTLSPTFAQHDTPKLFDFNGTNIPGPTTPGDHLILASESITKGLIYPLLLGSIGTLVRLDELKKSASASGLGYILAGTGIIVGIIYIIKFIYHIGKAGKLMNKS